ncbi:MAG: ABC transporter substrate-binding protein [Gammaproteobacteria bacterium]|nr:MAG: ABC transporter substrate-binding protein [Gammaproteobacteria bacterium]
MPSFVLRNKVVERSRSCFVILFLTLTLTACRSNIDKDLIRYGLDSMPVKLDPREATDATSYRINRLLYSALVDFDNSSKFIPGLASWQLINPTHYRFVLNQKRQPFHTGEKLTASDVKATYDWILDKENGSPHRQTLSIISEIKVVDLETVDFILNNPDPLFPAYLVIGIMPQKLISSAYDFNANPVGSGTFRYRSRPDPNTLKLERVRDKQVFEFIRIPSPEVRVMKLMRGEIDILQNGLMPELKRFLAKKGRASVSYLEGSDFAYLGFNLEDKVVGQLKVRQAIGFAIDREAILQNLYGGQEKLATTFFPAEHWLGNPAIKPTQYDPKRAKKLLKELGYSPDKPLELSYKTSTNPFRIRVATVIQDQLRQVGINMAIQSFDWGTFYGDIKAGRFQMYSLKWVGIKTPDIFEYVFHSKSIPPSGANRGRYTNQQVDQLIDSAKTFDDLDDRLEVFRNIQQLVFDDMAYVPLWYEGHFAATTNDLIGYRLTADGNYDSLNYVERKVNRMVKRKVERTNN